MPTEQQQDLIEVEENSFPHYCQRCEEGCVTIYRINVRSRSYRLEARLWCEDCRYNYSFECDDCNNRFDSDECNGSNSSGERVCEDCSQSYFTCEDCGHTFHNDDYSGDGRCGNCDRSSNTIGDYSDEPNLHPIGKPPHYYGVELEIEVISASREDKAERAASLLGNFAILKEDGSLHDGFEIVTRPASLEEQRKGWAKFFANRPSNLASFNTDSCGLHVHCSRKPLSELTIAKIVCFANAQHNRRFMSVIAGRPSGHWAAYKNKKLSDASKRNSDRYEAVNLQGEDTIEFRIFKGTLKQASVFKAIEFCDALIHFCLPASRSLRESMMRSEFTDYVRRNAKVWPHLAAFIDAKWYGHDSKAAEALGFSPQNRSKLDETTEE